MPFPKAQEMDSLCLGITAKTVSLVTSCAQVSNLLAGFHPPEGGIEDKKVKDLTSEISALSHVLSNIERTIQCQPFPYPSALYPESSSPSRAPSMISQAVSDFQSDPRASSDIVSIRSRSAPISALEAHWRSVEKVMADCNNTLQEIRGVLEDAVGRERRFMQKTRTHIRVAQFYSRVDSFVLRVRSYRDAVDITLLMLNLGTAGVEDPDSVREALEFVQEVRDRINGQRRRSGTHERDYNSFRSVGHYVKAAGTALAEISLRNGGVSKLSLDTESSWNNTSPCSELNTPSGSPTNEELSALKTAAIKGDLSTICTITEAYSADSLTSADIPPLVALAAKHHHDFCTNAFVSAGFGVNGTDEEGKTALHFACSNNDDHSFLVSSLLGSGADASKKTGSGSTPLHEAAASGNIPAINELLSHGADVDARENNGDTPLHRAASTADAVAVQALIDAGGKPCAKGSQDRTPIHCGSAAGNLGVLRVLLESGAEVNGKCGSGDTPLIYACECGAIACVRLLLDAGANVNLTGENGQTALHLACKNGFVDITETLVKAGAEVDIRSISGDTPLIYAAAGGNERIVRLLVEKGANVRTKGSNGNTAVEEAKAQNHDTIVGYLERVRLNLPSDTDTT